MPPQRAFVFGASRIFLNSNSVCAQTYRFMSTTSYANILTETRGKVTELRTNLVSRAIPCVSALARSMFELMLTLTKQMSS